MNRELKFRVWDSKNKQFILNSILTVGFYGDLYANSKKETDRGDFVIQQFAGICDKNQVSVYEGDILKVKGYFRGESEEYSTGVIKWDEYSCGFNVNIYKNGKSNWNIFYMSEIQEKNDFYVIGNIFKNPELLSNA